MYWSRSIGKSPPEPVRLSNICMGVSVILGSGSAMRRAAKPASTSHMDNTARTGHQSWRRSISQATPNPDIHRLHMALLRAGDRHLSDASVLARRKRNRKNPAPRPNPGLMRAGSSMAIPRVTTQTPSPVPLSRIPRTLTCALSTYFRFFEMHFEGSASGRSPRLFCCLPVTLYPIPHVNPPSIARRKKPATNSVSTQ